MFTGFGLGNFGQVADWSADASAYTSTLLQTQEGLSNMMPGLGWDWIMLRPFDYAQGRLARYDAGLVL